MAKLHEYCEMSENEDMFTVYSIQFKYEKLNFLSVVKDIARFYNTSPDSVTSVNVDQTALFELNSFEIITKHKTKNSGLITMVKSRTDINHDLVQIKTNIPLQHMHAILTQGEFGRHNIEEVIIFEDERYELTERENQILADIVDGK